MSSSSLLVYLQKKVTNAFTLLFIYVYVSVTLLERLQERIKVLRKKRLILVKQSRDDVARLLQRGQDADAVTRVEIVFREENLAGAYEFLEQCCPLAMNGRKSIKSNKDCSLEVKEAIHSLIYATPRCGELQELQKIREIFQSTYGPEYINAILELKPECAVNAQVIQKLSSCPPSSDVKLNLLKGIALEYKIEWNYQRAFAASSRIKELPVNEPKAPSVKNRVPEQDVDSYQSSNSNASRHINEGIDNLGLPEDKQTPSRDMSEKVKQTPSRNMSEKVKPRSGTHITSIQENVVRAKKNASVASAKTAEESSSDSISTHNASSSAQNAEVLKFHRTEHRKHESVEMTQASPAKESSKERKQSSFSLHRDAEYKGRQVRRIVNASSSSSSTAHHKDSTSTSSFPSMRPVSVFSDEEYIPESVSSSRHQDNIPSSSLQSLRSTSVSIDEDYFLEQVSSSTRVHGKGPLPLNSKASQIRSSDQYMSESAREAPFKQSVERTVTPPSRHQKKLSKPVPETQSIAEHQHEVVGRPRDRKREYREPSHTVKHQPEMVPLENSKHAMTGRTRPVASELRSMQTNVNQELEDLEATIEAIRAADLAIDMVRGNSKLRAQKRDSQSELQSQTYKNPPHGLARRF
ncbi:hypothetical protein KP509_32G071300 [Ceratopteris richardii]|uniref:Uncharacterized protein n=1 Tax=Ceratopteris richardii TaxID=49495 RepID=A0A8T2QUK2_CERRI|nr:hypothetical protein KP509_32G071300 [Ceratopteris richardii]